MRRFGTTFPRLAEGRIDPTATPGDRDVEQYLIEEAVLTIWGMEEEEREAEAERRDDVRAELRRAHEAQMAGRK